jgi:hypothetical protein
MANILVTEFKGIQPKIAKDKLPPNMAQIASDLKSASGDIKAYRRSTVNVALAGDSYKSLFQYTENSIKNWVYYDLIVHWVRSPTVLDTFERMYMTGADGGVKSQGLITFTDGMTDGETIVIGSETFEYDISEDGVAGANTLVGDSTTTTKELAASTLAALTPDADVEFTDNLDGTVTVTATNAGVAGDAIVLTEDGAHITVDGSGTLGATTTGVDPGKYKAFVNDIQEGGSFDFTTDFYFPGAPVNAALVDEGGHATASKVRSYLWTNVSRYGEEGPPSDILTITDYDSGTVTLSNFVEPSDLDEHLKRVVGDNAPAIRIYRTSSDEGGGAAFLFVAEVPVDNTGPSSTAWVDYEFEDDVAPGDLGAVLDSTFYDRAPDDLENLRGHPGGFFVASKGNVLYFSEPFAPWAWPEDYQIPIDQEIVGIGVYGSTIVLATDGHIYTFSGPHPTAMYKTKLSFQPCLSQRAVVESHDGVIFPSKEGFQHVTGGGVINITTDTFKPEDWFDYELETMHGTWYNKAYYGFYKSADHEGYIILDMLNGTITTGVDYHYAGYVTIANGTFHTIYFSDIELPTVLNISTWDADTTEYRMFNYKSPQYIRPKPINFKVAQVILDQEFYEEVLAIIADTQKLEDLNATAWGDGTVSLRGAFNANMLNEQDINGDTLYNLRNLGVQAYVNFKIYTDGELRWVKQISNSNIFKLPGGFKNKKWEWSVDGMIPVKRVTLATSTEEV